MEKELTYNTVIVGAGVSGLYAALKLPKEQNILLICKEDLPSCDSMLAQGGICVQRDETDYDSFFEDTLKAGHYENRKESVDIMIRNSRAVINDLLALGVLHFKLRHSDGPPLRHADGDQTVLATGHSALDKHEVLLSINADNGEVLHSHAGVAHVTGHLDALEDAGRVGALADGAGVTLNVGTVGHGAAVLIPALDATLEALTLGGADDVDLGDVLEIGDGDDVADLVLLAILDADLTKVTDGLDASLSKVTSHGLIHVLGLDVAEADLDGVVAVGRLSFNLRDGAGASLDDRDGDDVIVLVPNLGHADLAAENHVDHSISNSRWSWDIARAPCACP